MGETAQVSINLRGVRVAVAVSQSATGLITNVSVNDTPVDFHPLHGPQGQSTSSIPSSSDAEAAELPPPPPAVLGLSQRLVASAGAGRSLLSPRARVLRAYRAGQRALAALDAGDAERGEGTPDCGLPSRSYVLLQPASVAGGRPTVVKVSTLRALRAAAGGDISRDTVVYHGFASVSESNAYCWGAGAPQ